jgi:hypothetical protein
MEVPPWIEPLGEIWPSTVNWMLEVFWAVRVGWEEFRSRAVPEAMEVALGR